MKRSIAVVCVGALMCAKVVAEEVAPANTPVAAPSQQEAVQPRFAVWEFRVKGNTLLQQTAIELTLTPFLGPDQTFDTIQEAASKLERSYRDAGYPTVLVNIPEQDVVGGVVTLDVVEGKVSRVRVSGSRYFLPSEIKQEVGSLQQGQPMHVPSFQADMNRVNSASGDLRVTPVLKPGSTPGTVEVDLRVKDELPLHGSLEVNNHNSLDTTKLRTSASISYDNLWQKHHSISLQTQNSPEEPDESRVLAGTYIFPVVDDVSRVVFYAVTSESDVSTFTDLTVVGNGEIYGTRLVRALDSSPGYVHSLSLGFDLKDFDESVNLVGADTDSTPIKYSIFTAMYNGSFLRDDSTSRVGFSVTNGLRDFLGGGDAEEFQNKRYYSHPNFFYVQGNFKHQERFENDWRLNGRAKIQIADSALISNEQLSAGGSASVRGYYESQDTGDHGVVASADVETPDILESKSSELRMRAFVDGAWLQMKDALSTDDQGDNRRVETEDTLLSAGLGTDFSMGKSLFFTLDLGVALREAVDVEEGDLRSHASLVLEF